MLTTDLIRVRRRGGRICVVTLSGAQRERLLELASQYIAVAQAHQQQHAARADFDADCDDVPHEATDYKLVKGLRKLLVDRCTFAPVPGIEPARARQEIFRRAATLRNGLEDGARFDAQAVLAAAGEALALPAAALEALLFADLQDNHRLHDFAALTPKALLDAYELGQRQAVLLRAVRVVVRLRPSTPGAFRLFFRRLKFRRLLFQAAPADGAGSYLITLDGPLSLFQSVTKYGLQLALLLPALDEAGAWELDADVVWGNTREPFTYHLEGGGAAAAATSDDEAAGLPDEVAALLERFAERRERSPWQAAVARTVLQLPGVGLCVPDLVFTHTDSGQQVYLEVMGYWSRDAVWRRVELVQAGLDTPIIFAVSSHLRVSEQVLDNNLPGQLYVYKTAMSAAALEERLTAALR